MASRTPRDFSARNTPSAVSASRMTAVSVIQDQGGRIHTRVDEGVGDQRGQVRVGELAGRQVDRDVERAPVRVGGVPTGSGAAG
jgi:hypothetical protein